MTMIPKFRRPASVDDTVLDKMLVKSYRDERARRVRTVDDSFRDKVSTNLPCGEFSLATISTHDLVEQRAFDTLGGLRVGLNQSYRCPHCGTEYACAYPPQYCNVCHQRTWFGELVANGSFRR